jgi:hypothetical protein
MIGDDRNKPLFSAKAMRWCTCGQTHHPVSGLEIEFAYRNGDEAVLSEVASTDVV